MCGIIGYIGNNQALPILIEGLRRMEYRGYDSSGVALNNNNIIKSVKAVGKIENLEKKLGKIKGTVGIAHTRWATHGEPTEENAHPHSDCSSKIWVVHNGIIENYQDLKNELKSRGHKFMSDTDTEVIAHLVEDVYNGDIASTTKKIIKLIKGAYGIVVMHADEPNRLIAARYGSPLVIGFGENETILASDVSAILRHTNQVLYLEDGELVDLKRDTYTLYNSKLKEKKAKLEEIEWDIDMAEKKGYKHFMKKEIFEQPESVTNSIRGRLVAKDGKVKLGGLDSIANITRFIEKVNIVACGTAFHAGLVAKMMLEEYAGLPTDVEYASEFRYRKPALDQRTAVLAISQSGETADTLAALKEAKEKGCLSLGVVNVVGSTIARESEAGVYNHIGPEIAVASTKAYTSQLAILTLFTIFFGRQRQMSMTMGKRIVDELKTIPAKIDWILKQDKKIYRIAKKYQNANHFMYIGRKYNYPTALEGALKLKELSYIHAEGAPSGELKHGPIAMIDEKFPSLCIAPQDSVYEKNKSNIEEIKARKGKVISITTKENKELNDISDDVIFIPKTLEMLTPILATIPLQIFAYYMAVLNNRDVDKPRNLAKSVTVE